LLPENILSHFYFWCTVCPQDVESLLEYGKAALHTNAGVMLVMIAMVYVMVKQIQESVMTLAMPSSTTSAHAHQQQYTNEEASMTYLHAFCRRAGMKSQTTVLALKASQGACACCFIRPLLWGHGQTG
jgi:hypothetical protein